MNSPAHPLATPARSPLAPVLRVAELRALEQTFASAEPPLMERAGLAAAKLAATLARGRSAAPLIFAGPGNNGGDAFVVARHLHAWGLQPTLVFAADTQRLPADAKQAYAAWRAVGGNECAAPPPGPWGLIVDGLFGIGLMRAVDGMYGEWIGYINRQRATAGTPVLALDCPSGLDGDTGVVVGAPASHVVHATHTLTFISLKAGLLTLDGPDHCGSVNVADLGLGSAVASLARGCVLAPSHFAEALLPRRQNSHKGTYGSAGVVGGASGMAGAALLAGRAALKIGSGRVFVGMLERLALDTEQAELMLREAGEIQELASALAIGPGLGQSAAALDLLRRAVDGDKPLLIDADALNLLAAHPALHAHVYRRHSGTVMTPHPLEAARLLGVEVAEVQQNRVATTLELARRFNACVALKGNGTVLANTDGQWAVNTRGNPGLASAGSGDVLSGLMLGFLAQGQTPATALAAGVYLHSVAADDLAAAGNGPIGIAAGELIDAARRHYNALIQPPRL